MVKEKKEKVKKPTVQVIITKIIPLPMGGQIKRIKGERAIELTLGNYGENYVRNWSVNELMELKQAINLILNIK